MQSKDKISKAAWNQFQGARDSVVKNVIDAIHDGKIKVEAISVQKLVDLISASLEQGYHRGYSVFNREVESTLTEAINLNNVTVTHSQSKKK